MKKILWFALATAATAALPFAASAAALSVSCVGVASTSSIAWTAFPVGGNPPVALLWGNGATTTTQTVLQNPGTYSMTLQATDASSTVVTTVCSATVAQPVPASTSTTDEIRSILQQIATLRDRLAQLLAQQASTPPVVSTTTATSTPCFSFGKDLEEGDRGGDVEDLQKTLAHDPSVFPEGLVTGFFGHKTAEAVKKFQEKHGLPSTGLFGPMSRRFFGEQCSAGDSNHDGVPDSLDEGGHSQGGED